MNNQRAVSSALLCGLMIALLIAPGFAGTTNYWSADSLSALSSLPGGLAARAPLSLCRTRRNAVYRTRNVYYERRRPSRTRTVLRIAAPAAIGAGIGALAGGGRGAGAGALIGGGAGAVYHLIRSRR